MSRLLKKAVGSAKAAGGSQQYTGIDPAGNGVPTAPGNRRARRPNAPRAHQLGSVRSPLSPGTN